MNLQTFETFRALCIRTETNLLVHAIFNTNTCFGCSKFLFFKIKILLLDLILSETL